jgi:glutaredoxin
MAGPVFFGFYRRSLLAAATALLCCACGNKLPEEIAGEFAQPSGELIKPPFAVRGELQGLLLVWFDEQGLHTARKRSEIPGDRRQFVRVDSLEVPPEKRVDQDYLYVGDLRKAAGDGSYPVRKCRRDWFDSLVDRAAAPPASETAAGTPDGQKPPAGSETATVSEKADVVLYSASWCGACRAARDYLKSHHIAFVEKDIEKDRDSYAEMQRKARAAGVRPGALPMIDVKGKLLSGFDPAAVQRLLAR